MSTLTKSTATDRLRACVLRHDAGDNPHDRDGEPLADYLRGIAPLGRYALVEISADERSGVPAIHITPTFATPTDAARTALERVGDPLYPTVPIEVLDLATGARLRPNWHQLPWHALPADHR